MVRQRKRMEERRKKRNRLKATMAVLILTLVAGSAQGLSTYALFTDKVDLAQSISISLGDLDAKVSEGFNTDDYKVNKENSSISKEFTITNNGTLKQSLNLALEFGKDISDEVLKNINYTIESVDKKFNTISGTMDTLKSGKDIVSGNKSLLVLESNEALNCKATVTFEEPALTALSEKTFSFNLAVKAKQVNWTEGGFYDVANQSNSIKVEKAKPDIGNNEGEVVFDYCPCEVCITTHGGRAKAFKVDASNIIDIRKLESQGVDNQWYVNDGSAPDDNNKFSLHVADKDSGILYFVPGNGETATIDEIVNRRLQVQLNFTNNDKEVYIVTFEKRDGIFISKWDRKKSATLEIVPVVDEEENSSNVDESLNSEASAPVVEGNLEVPNKEVVEPVKEEEIEPSNLNDLKAIKKEELQE